jgi:hypothetical protein
MRRIISRPVMQTTDHQAPDNTAELRVFDDAATLNWAVASHIVALATAAVDRTGGIHDRALRRAGAWPGV